MVKSMTGFGRGCYEEENFSVTVEIKSVNHRYKIKSAKRSLLPYPEAVLMFL